MTEALTLTVTHQLHAERHTGEAHQSLVFPGNNHTQDGPGRQVKVCDPLAILRGDGPLTIQYGFLKDASDGLARVSHPLRTIIPPRYNG